ncbi:hypothetical protein ANO11243_052270 [Dothideomycetidae sp. 11243]|nr:hypothetical protein ANO11243_052270 [fungal sp. No.11243]
MPGGTTSKRAYSTPTRPRPSAALATLTVEEFESFVDYEPEPVDLMSEDLANDFMKDRDSEIGDERLELVSAGPTSPLLEETIADTAPSQLSNNAGSPMLKLVKHTWSEDWYWRRVRSLGDKVLESHIADLERVLERQDNNIEQLSYAYHKIPEPRVKYLGHRTLTDLLKTLRQAEIKTAECSKLYMIIMDDMARSAMDPSVRDLTSALVFAGRIVGIDPNEGLEKAMDIFRQMEEGNRRADIVTFNTLGDLALRARRFDLFRSLLTETKQRGIQQDRYTGMLKIRYWGLLRNASRVKRAYRDMVAQGELVDTVVLNCVIKYLSVAGDHFTAEKTFERMKEIDDDKSHRQKVVPSDQWDKQRQLAKILRYSSWLFRFDRKSLQQLQDATPTCPNTHTYRIIIRHHCFATGNLHRIIDLLVEMQDRGLFLTRPVFFMVFAGFATHRRGNFSPWSIFQLNSMFELLMRYVDLSKDIAITHGMPQKYDNKCELNGRIVEVILQAYAEHSNSAKVRQVWEHIRAKWDAAEATVQHMEEYVSSLEASADSTRRRIENDGIEESHTDMVQRFSQWDDDDELYRLEMEDHACL